jgi:hypothetical protein
MTSTQAVSAHVGRPDNVLANDVQILSGMEPFFEPPQFTDK